MAGLYYSFLGIAPKLQLNHSSNSHYGNWSLANPLTERTLQLFVKMTMLETHSNRSIMRIAEIIVMVSYGLTPVMIRNSNHPYYWSAFILVDNGF